MTYPVFCALNNNNNNNNQGNVTVFVHKRGVRNGVRVTFQGVILTYTSPLKSKSNQTDQLHVRSSKKYLVISIPL